MRRTGSTTSPTRWACRRCCSSGIWRRRARSARWRSATRTRGPAGETFRIRQDASQDIHIEGLPVGTVGGILAKTTLPLDGTYDFSIKLFRTNLGVVRGLEYEHQLEYTVDGARVHVSRVGGEEDFRANLKNMTKAGDDVEARAHIRIPLKAGPHVITAAFLERSDAINPLRLQPFIRSSNDTLDTIGHPHLDTFTLTGPFNPTGPGRHAQPPQDLHLPPIADRHRRRLRAPHRLDARAPGVPRAGEPRPTSSACTSSS